MTLHERLAAGCDRLVAAGIARDEAAIDVDVFARTILGWDRTRVLLEHHASVPETLEPRFSEWIARREQREPTAYIVGVREFWGLDFVVSPEVLIPRPETEFIVEEALTFLRGVPSPKVADVGTGSGCVAVALAHELPAATVTATDISSGAIDVARANATRHGVADRVIFVQTSYLDEVMGPFDAIVSNPPYVKEHQRAMVSRSVVRYEPHVALFGGEHGLDGVTAILSAAEHRLVPGGWLIFEFGLGQDEEVRELVRRYPRYRMDRIREDLQGIPRTAVVQRLA